MSSTTPKQLRWTRHVEVPGSSTTASPGPPAMLSTRERLVAALADRPRTVAQLAHQFGLSQPTMLEQVRRAMHDGLIVEEQVPSEEKRYPSERYYTPAVPVVRQPDREILESTCRGIAHDLAASLSRNEADLRAAFAMTHVARDGWELNSLWPYIQETIVRQALEHMPGFIQPDRSSHGLSWVEEVVDATDTPVQQEGAA